MLTAVEVSGGALTVAAYVVSRMAKLAGNADVAMKALSVSRMASITLSKCVTIVELVSGALAVVDPDATWGQRLNGAVTVGTSALALAGEKVASANPAALALTGGWELFKWAVSTFYGASVGITSGLMEAPLKVLADRGTTIAHLTSDAINSKLLMEKETDSEKRSALQKVHEVRIYQLQHELDDLIADTSPMSKVAGMAKHPGAHKILNEAFIPLRGFRGATREDVTMQGAALALQRVQFLLSHAPEFRVAAAEGKGWDETAKAVEARDKKPAKGH